MAIKEADMSYISKETEEFLGKKFKFNPDDYGAVATRKGAVVSLLYMPNWEDWIKGMFYTAYTTWDNHSEISLPKIYEESTLDEIASMTVEFLKKRPIAACLESAVFVFRIDNIPRTMTHQIVRHRGMSFNQESYRVSPCHHADMRIPDGLNDEQQNMCEKHADYSRDLYNKLIEDGVPIEQARNVMPMGTCTHITMTTSLKELQKYIRARTMEIAQDEHTYIVALILDELRKYTPEFYENFIRTKETDVILLKYLGE